MKASSHLVSQYKFKPLIRWVEKMAELCTPQSIHWVELIGQEELFFDLHEGLPKEMLYERELLICRM
jgi:GTP-dependent phosphoenolpyruvate carboxykinase